MRILIAHNRYRQPGGEDSVVRDEAQLLKDFGHDVHVYERSNTELDSYNFVQKIQHLASLSGRSSSYKHFFSLAQEFKPDIIHCHNIHYMMTPSVYEVARDLNTPVLQSLHNFRLLCSNALFYRDGHPCEKCLDKNLWQGVKYGCYQDSRAITAAVVWMLRKHWRQGTWVNAVDAYIATNAFVKSKYVQAGIPEHKIVIKPNFSQSVSPSMLDHQGYALYSGRLSEEKGVEVLLRAWQGVKNVSLKILGEGPLRHSLEQLSNDLQIHNVEFLGYQTGENYQDIVSKAKFLVIPSVCYENFPRVIPEAFSCGVPVIASRTGSLEQIIKDGESGFLFKSGDAAELALCVQKMNDESRLSKMRKCALKEFKEKYNAATNYQDLIEIYGNILSSRKAQVSL